LKIAGPYKLRFPGRKKKFGIQGGKVESENVLLKGWWERHGTRKPKTYYYETVPGRLQIAGGGQRRGGGGRF